MWFREYKKYFCKIENLAYGENSERSFSNPHPCLIKWKCAFVSQLTELRPTHNNWLAIVNITRTCYFYLIPSILSEQNELKIKLQLCWRRRLWHLFSRMGLFFILTQIPINFGPASSTNNKIRIGIYQVTSHHLNQWWASVLMHLCITRLQGVDNSVAFTLGKFR